MARIILHVEIPENMSVNIDSIASLMRVNRSTLVRWFIEDGILEYTARIRQSEATPAENEEGATNGAEKPIT